MLSRESRLLAREWKLLIHHIPCTNLAKCNIKDGGRHGEAGHGIDNSRLIVSKAEECNESNDSE